MHIVCGRGLLTQTRHNPVVCHRVRLHVSSTASMCSSKTETRNSSEGQKEEKESEEGPEYIPRRKAKNPMMKIGYAWSVCTFYLTIPTKQVTMTVNLWHEWMINISCEFITKQERQQTITSQDSLQVHFVPFFLCSSDNLKTCLFSYLGSLYWL